jgi:hypothetical protein
MSALRVAILTCIAAGCASTRNYGGWNENHTRNVTVYTDATLEHIYMQEWLERSYRAYQAFFPGLKVGDAKVVWLRNEPGLLTRIFSPFDDPPSGWTLETVPSGSRIGRDGLIVLERRDEMVPSGDSFRMISTRDETLAKKQMAHLFIMRAVPLAPLWLQVGLGRYMSKFRVHYRGDYYVACFGSPVFDEPIRMLAEGRAAGDGRRVSISVDELFNTDWYRYDGRLRYWYEHTAYAMVHYLIHGERGFNGTRFSQFLQALREGRDTEEALALAYPHILPNEWDEKLMIHMRPLNSRAMLAENPQLKQGLCMRIPTEHDADFKPSKRTADPREIQVLLEDLERVEPFRRHGGWMPTDIVEAEAAKRPRKSLPGGGSGPGTGGEKNGRGPGTGTPGTPGAPDEGSTPTIRIPIPAPPPQKE